MSVTSSVSDSLQREFCPPLDSSLVAALVAELESDGAGNVIFPSPSQLDNLRVTLREFSVQADESQFFDELAATTEETNSSSYFHDGDTTTSPTSLSSTSSEPSQHSFESPLGFLQAALPHVATQTLSSALKNAGPESVDMWDVVAGILTAESIRELEERGLDGLEEDLQQVSPDEDSGWQTVETRRKHLPRPPLAKQNNKRGGKITLGNAPQQQRALAIPKRSGVESQRSASSPDPWTQLSSLSSYLSSLLSPHPPSLFLSYFHSPEYPTPYLALHACLAKICKGHPKPSLEEYTERLFILLDVLSPTFGPLGYEEHGRLVSDVEISLHTTGGNGDETLDLVKLLRDLDTDSQSYLEMGVYHVTPQVSVRKPRPRQTQPPGPPPVPPLPQYGHNPKPPPAPLKKSPYQWQSVPKRRIPNKGPHPLAIHIPAYARNVNDKKVMGVGNTFDQGGIDDLGELSEHKRKITESMRKRDDLLRRATWMWQRGNSNNRGGEAALYFAERAREFQESARKEALDAARVRIKSRRFESNDPSTVDLHGATAAEAVVLVKEILKDEGSSGSKPLKIITGRGSHSVNQVSVLKPAVRKALLEDGWVVGTWDGGLIVRGKRGA